MVFRDLLSGDDGLLTPALIICYPAIIDKSNEAAIIHNRPTYQAWSSRLNCSIEMMTLHDLQMIIFFCQLF